MAKDFNSFVQIMYSAVVPSRGYDIVDDGTYMRAHFARTGFVPVIEFDGAVPDVFENIDTYYQFRAWVEYSKIIVEINGGSVFETMQRDIARIIQCSRELTTWLTIIDGLVNAQEEYAAKFRHHPVNLPKFINSFVKRGRSCVLRADVY